MAGGGPRRIHPPLARPTVARISPMVPEVSMVLGDFVDNSGPSNPYLYQHRRPKQTFQLSSTNSSGAMRPLDPPSPQKNLMQSFGRPTPDFSSVFDQVASSPSHVENLNPVGCLSEKRIKFPEHVEPIQTCHSQPFTTDTFKRDSAVSDEHISTTSFQLGSPKSFQSFNQDKSSSLQVHPEILKVLSWQNEQLKLLQNQVQILLQSSPQAPSNQREPLGDTRPLVVDRRVSSVSTNTSLVWPEIQKGLRRLQDAAIEEEEVGNNTSEVSLRDLRSSNIKVNCSDAEPLRSPQPTINIDLPDYPGSECSPDLRTRGDRLSWESPVLGESVSMYEEQEDVGEVYNDILHKVQQLLSEPSVQSTVVNEPNTAKEGEVDENLTSNYPVAATLNRLRELGISFISPEELCRGSEDTIETKLNDCSHMFLPKAACPSQSVWKNSPDTSLEISSLALKYLDEHQLSRLADQHRSSESAGMSRGESNVSLATQQFLNRHGLGFNESSSLRRVSSAPLLDLRSPIINGRNNQEARHAATRRPLVDTAKEQIQSGHQPRFIGGTQTSDQNQRQNGALAPPGLPNRILDITAIRQQPKLL